MLSNDIVLEAVAVEQVFSLPRRLGQPERKLRAVRGVDLRLTKGETLALVGESGCGKSTLVRMLLGLTTPSVGDVRLLGKHIANYSRSDIAKLIQPVFQDPYASLNPSKRVEDIIALPLVVNTKMGSAERRAAVLSMMDLVGLPAAFASRSPSELSGGQRQRVAIARALVSRPKVLICDEPTSALDVSVQAQILNLLQDLRAELDLTYLIVTHNLAVVETIADRVSVMYFGRIVETGPTEAVLQQSRHPYTKLLSQSALPLDPDHRLPENVDEVVFPDPLNPKPGCSFQPRCGRATALCAEVEPLASGTEGQVFACHNPETDIAPPSIGEGAEILPFDRLKGDGATTTKGTDNEEETFGGTADSAHALHGSSLG